MGSAEALISGYETNRMSLIADHCRQERFLKICPSSFHQSDLFELSFKAEEWNSVRLQHQQQHDP